MKKKSLIIVLSMIALAVITMTACEKTNNIETADLITAEDDAIADDIGAGEGDDAAHHEVIAPGGQGVFDVCGAFGPGAVIRAGGEGVPAGAVIYANGDGGGDGGLDQITKKETCQPLT